MTTAETRPYGILSILGPADRPPVGYRPPSWEAARLAEADRRHDEAVAKVLRRVRRGR